MASRPVFVIYDKKPYFKEIITEFKYYPGFALSQSRKSIQSLHESFVFENQDYSDAVLEISSKSNSSLGCRLSAFNLMYCFPNGKKYFLESVFQSSKYFSNGKQYIEILDMSPAEAKHFPGLRNSGEIVKFRLEETEFQTEPKTYFYDWLYVNALYQNPTLSKEIMSYHAFTDIVFNPSKSINCQARSAALFVSLKQAKILEDAISNPKRFLETIYVTSEDKTDKNTQSWEQLSMLDI